jgi:hypothetical protein
MPDCRHVDVSASNHRSRPIHTSGFPKPSDSIRYGQCLPRSPRNTRVDTAVLNEKGPVGSIIAVGRDIEEQRQTEKPLLESEGKLAIPQIMESMGLLAGGVAHDLNNILSGTVSHPELVSMDQPEESKLRRPIEATQDAVLPVIGKDGSPSWGY